MDDLGELINNEIDNNSINISNNVNYTYNVDDYFDDNNTYYDVSDRYNDQRARELATKIIALVLGFFAISLNVMSLLALSQIKSRITTHHRLIISLAVSDMVIGVSIVLQFINTSVNVNYRPGMGPPSGRLRTWCSSVFIRALHSTGLNISLLNLMAMAIDHYMAIIRPLHYPAQMNKSNAYIMIALLWIVAIILGFSDFFTGFRIYNKYKPKFNYCEAIYKSKYQDEYTCFAIALLATIVMLFIYSRIYIKIKKHRTPGEVNPSIRRGSIRSDLPRNVRALITTLLILGTFMICWLPNCIYQISMVILVKKLKEKIFQYSGTLFIFDQCMWDLLLLNAIADPIIYAVRMYDVQMGYRQLMKKCIPHSSFTREGNSYMGTKLFMEKKSSVSHSFNGERVELKKSKRSLSYSSNSNNKKKKNSTPTESQKKYSLSENSSTSVKTEKTIVKSYDGNSICENSGMENK